jgi:putative transposase
MSASGNCYNNAVIARFFGVLKHEWVKKYKYVTRDEEKLEVSNYIECFYNRKKTT